MSLKSFFQRFTSIILTFPYEWRRINKETGNYYVWFLIFESILSGITFLLGALWTFGVGLGINFLLVRALVFSVVLFAYIIILAKVFSLLCNYYKLKLNGKLAERLVVYVSGFYFASIFIGTLFSPENYFFILFVFAFFSGYYFSRVLLRYFKKNLYAIFSGVVLFLFHLISYFVFINLLATIK
jgi:hypothetical protein